jgi:hypothetical protein
MKAISRERFKRGVTMAYFRKARIALFIALFFVGISAAQTGTIFNNITSPCSPYSQTPPNCGYYPVFGPTGDFAVPNSDFAAAKFTPSAGGTATDARVVVVQNAPGPGFNLLGSLDVAIFSDAGGLPGSQISQTVTNLTAPYCCRNLLKK